VKKIDCRLTICKKRPRRKKIKKKKNRLYIIIASVAVIIGSVLPWGTVNLGGFGGLSVSGIR